MEKRKLGKSGLLIRPVGLGCAAIGGFYTRNGNPNGRGPIDKAEVTRAIHLALGHEIQLFDVGNIYGAGDAERLLGQALATSDQGKSAILQVKFGASFDEVTRRQIDYEGKYELAWMRASLEASLRRLQREVIEIFQFQIGNYDLDGQAEIIAGLNELVQEGKILSYSIGTPDLDRAGMFARAPHCAAILHSHNVMQPAGPILALCAENGVASLGGIPYFMGALVDPNAASRDLAENDVRAGIYSNERFKPMLAKMQGLHPLMTRDGRSLVSGALGWVWAQGDHTIPLPGFRNQKQVQAVIDALEVGPLAEATLVEIDEALGR